MIIAISGLNGAGKGEVVRYLERRSFAALSLSDVIRDELAALGIVVEDTADGVRWHRG